MDQKKQKTVDIIIPVYRPAAGFGRVLRRLQRQTWPVGKIILINTEEKLWNPELVRGIRNVELHHVAREEFDHGGTRNLGASFSRADIMVFMTDDAVPRNRYLIENLVQGLEQTAKSGHDDKTVQPVMAYARQLARADCPLAEQYTRSFNYPPYSFVKTQEDLPRLGIKTYFASNVCCAYDRVLFKQLGGFTERTIFNEDMIFAANAMKHGFAVFYAADAQVIHSHRYTPMQQLRRNFDLAVSQADHPEVFAGIPSEGEGMRLVSCTAGFLIKSGKPWLLAGLAVSSGFKYFGYCMGKVYRRLPLWLVRRLTMNAAYWAEQGGETAGQCCGKCSSCKGDGHI